ncbi:MAG: hypothetical protein ACI978_000013 [Oleispira sp.]|jgi:hypothetical protein
MSNELMKIIFLDRNVISTIKDHLLGNNVDVKRLARLRDIDKSNIVISAIFSIREGQSAKLESSEEMLKTLQGDYEAIERFFKNARFDKEFLDGRNNEFIDAFCGEKEELWSGYEILIKYVRKELYQPVKKIDREAYKEKILSLAREHGIPNGHPVLMCCLALLYGSSDAQKIIKPKKTYSPDREEIDIYNSLSDLIVLSRLSGIYASSTAKSKGRLVVKYLTFDKGLDGFLKKTKLIKSVKIKETNTTVTNLSTTTYSIDLFPHLNETEYLDLHREMGATM